MIYISRNFQRVMFICQFGKWVGDILQMGFQNFHMLETYVGRVQGNFKFGVASCFCWKSLEIPFIITAFSRFRIPCMLGSNLLFIVGILLGQEDLEFYLLFRFWEVLFLLPWRCGYPRKVPL